MFSTKVVQETKIHIIFNDPFSENRNDEIMRENMAQPDRLQMAI